ncbi:hypothetical protein F5879DRAFT_673014 [Lentinula edodes]|nr:hypothetical protein F5879DRAFT_673014 [Lentinula edodes]
MSKSQDYPDSFELMEGVTMTFEPQVRIVKIRGAPDDDIFRVPSHWHEDHDEIMTIYEGRLKITLGGQTKVYTPESGEVFIPRGVPHSIESFKGEACLASERTNPTEFGQKLLRNPCSCRNPGFLGEPFTKFTPRVSRGSAGDVPKIDCRHLAGVTMFFLLPSNW